MQAAAFSPAASLPSFAQAPSQQQYTFVPTVGQEHPRALICASPWSPAKSSFESPLAQKGSQISDRESEFAAFAHFSDHSSAVSTDTSSTSSATSEPSSPSQSYRGALSHGFQPQAAPFKVAVQSFVPSAPAFVPTSSFQPAPQLQSYSQQPFYPQATFTGPSSGPMQGAYQPYYPQACPQFEEADPDRKYKTELCKNWIEAARCRYESKCRFAHGQEELTAAAMRQYNEKFKSKNCRTFYQTRQCMFGARCMFRHEHRNYRQLHRHYYTPHLYVLESALGANTQSSANFQPATPRLSVFRQIEAQGEAEEACLPLTEDSSDCEVSTESIGADFDCSMEKIGNKSSNRGSFLNTTVDSVNDEIAHKFAQNLFYSPARMESESSDSESGAECDLEDIPVSVQSLELDFE